MGGSPVVEGLAQVEWGTATAECVAAEPEGRAGEGGARPDGDWPTARHAGLWSAGLEALTGASIGTYRTVLGWQHVQPDGPGSWHPAALARCDRALDDALARGRKPALTLLHLDLPGWADESGGWMCRTTASRFADYAVAMGERFGDRVDRWITSSDLVAPSVGDHVAGMFPPGRGRGPAGLASVHHLLLGHGLATQGLRELGVAGWIGTTANLYGGYPATSDPWDRLAVEEFETWGNGLFLDPLLLGHHLSHDGLEPLVERTGCVRPGDLEVIAEPVDLLGLSWHEPCRITAPENLPLLLPAHACFGPLNDANRLLARLGFVVAPFDDVETNRFGWPLIPEGLVDALASLQQRYGTALPALHVVDNGMGDLHLAGDVGDAERYRTLLGQRLAWLARAVADGLDVRWYEYWSVLDNLGWKANYAQQYARSISDREAEVLPPLPRDWTGPAAQDLLPAVPVPTPADPSNRADRLHALRV